MSLYRQIDLLERDTTIYGLIDPRTSQLRYVGKTVLGLQDRLNRHCNESNTEIKNHRVDWIRNLAKAGLRPEIIELETVRADWIEAEQFWISYMRFIGCELVNATFGGEGAPGIKPTRLARLRMSRSQLGRKHSAATRKKISESNMGKRHTALTLEKLRRSQKRRQKRSPSVPPVLTDEIKLKISKSLTGRKHSLSTRIKMSRSQTGRVHTQETKDKISAGNKGLKRTDEMRAAMRRVWKDRRLSNPGMGKKCMLAPFGNRPKYILKVAYD